MAYDNFENTPFDFNHDGHIDSNEAAYIYESLYAEDNTKDYSSYDEDDKDEEPLYGGSYISRGNLHIVKSSGGKTIKELRDEAFRKKIMKDCIIMAAGVVVWEFLGGYYVTGIIGAGILLAFGFWFSSDK